jgi:hypothetical protein
VPAVDVDGESGEAVAQLVHQAEGRRVARVVEFEAALPSQLAAIGQGLTQRALHVGLVHRTHTVTHLMQNYT